MAAKAPTAKQTLGKWGEDLAAARLAGAGYVIIERNWRRRGGEIDIIARAPDGTLCFVEVRTRRGMRFGGAAASVTPLKRRRMAALAAQYLAEAGVDAPARFDVIATQRDGAAWHTEHFVGAFVLEES